MYDVIIIGSGPAGLTAAIYTTRANLKTLIIAGVKWGGQLMLTTLVENYPGFPDGIQGPDLMMAMRKQAERFGAEIKDIDFKTTDFSPLRQGPVPSGTGQGFAGQAKRPFNVLAGDKSYEGRSVIIATGADTKWLDVKGEKEKIGHGVSSCAPCDAFFFKEKQVIVVGGGDSAMEEALVLTKFASSVTLVHRRDEFRASKIMQDRARSNPKMKFILNSEVTEILGENKVTGVKIKNNKTNEVLEMPIDGIFVAIGHIPNSTAFKGIDVDKKGFIKVADHYKTNIDGVFVAGDVHDSHYKQAVTAAGFGCMAALEVEKWLSNQED